MLVTLDVVAANLASDVAIDALSSDDSDRCRARKDRDGERNQRDG